MAGAARSGLKPQNTRLRRLFFEWGRRPRPPARTSQTATSHEPVAPQTPEMTPPGYAGVRVTHTDSSHGCGSSDGRARRLWGCATHHEPRNSPPFPQSETRTAVPARQTTRGYLAQAGVRRASGRSLRSVPLAHTRREVRHELACE